MNHVWSFHSHLKRTCLCICSISLRKNLKIGENEAAVKWMTFEVCFFPSNDCNIPSTYILDKMSNFAARAPVQSPWGLSNFNTPISPWPNVHFEWVLQPCWYFLRYHNLRFLIIFSQQGYHVSHLANFRVLSRLVQGIQLLLRLCCAPKRCHKMLIRLLPTSPSVHVQGEGSNYCCQWVLSMALFQGGCRGL